MDLPAPVRILVVDDDARLLGRMRTWLVGRRVTVHCAQTPVKARATASGTPIDLAVIDYRLPGEADGLTLAANLFRDLHVPFVLVSGFLETAVTVRAMRLGASDVLDKPFNEAQLWRAITGALLKHAPDAAASSSETTVADFAAESTSHRWARLVLRSCEATRDPTTVKRLARAGGVSVPVFRSICSLSGVKAKQACSLGRFLRALARSGDGSMLASHLAIADVRTARHLFAEAALPMTARRVGLREFLLNQRFVSIGLDCVRELAHQAANSPYFSPDSDGDSGV